MSELSVAERIEQNHPGYFDEAKQFLDSRELRISTRLPISLQIQSKEVFRVTPDGEIEKDGVQITDDNAAVAQAFRDWIVQSYKVTIRPAKKELP